MCCRHNQLRTIRGGVGKLPHDLRHCVLLRPAVLIEPFADRVTKMKQCALFGASCRSTVVGQHCEEPILIGTCWRRQGDSGHDRHYYYYYYWRQNLHPQSSLPMAGCYRVFIAKRAAGGDVGRANCSQISRENLSGYTGMVETWLC
jgi:hypothetical protein